MAHVDLGANVIDVLPESGRVGHRRRRTGIRPPFGAPAEVALQGDARRIIKVDDDGGESGRPVVVGATLQVRRRRGAGRGSHGYFSKLNPAGANSMTNGWHSSAQTQSCRRWPSALRPGSDAELSCEAGGTVVLDLPHLPGGSCDGMHQATDTE